MIRMAKNARNIPISCFFDGRTHAYLVGLKRTLLCALICLALPAMTQGKAALPSPFGDSDCLWVTATEAKWGQLLFWDPILSGNRTMSCATCHHPRFGTGDGVSLNLGEGGLGPARVANSANLLEQRIPGNAPALFNLGLRGISALFHAGRIVVDRSHPSGLCTPMAESMAPGVVSFLSAQTMFPVQSGDEMLGHNQERVVAITLRQGRITGPGGAWDRLSKRVDGQIAFGEGDIAARL